MNRLEIFGWLLLVATWLGGLSGYIDVGPFASWYLVDGMLTVLVLTIVSLIIVSLSRQAGSK